MTAMLLLPVFGDGLFLGRHTLSILTGVLLATGWCVLRELGCSSAADSSCSGGIYKDPSTLDMSNTGRDSSNSDIRKKWIIGVQLVPSAIENVILVFNLCTVRK